MASRVDSTATAAQAIRSVGVAVCLAVMCDARLVLADDSDERLKGIPSQSIASSLPYQGDPGGVRQWLAGRGVYYGLVYTGEAYANAAGGLRRGAIYEDKFETYLAAWRRAWTSARASRTPPQAVGPG